MPLGLTKTHFSYQLGIQAISLSLEVIRRHVTYKDFISQHVNKTSLIKMREAVDWNLLSCALTHIEVMLTHTEVHNPYEISCCKTRIHNTKDITN